MKSMNKNVFTIVEYEAEHLSVMNHVLELRKNGERVYQMFQTYEMNNEQRASSRKVFMKRVEEYVKENNGVLVMN